MTEQISQSKSGISTSINIFHTQWEMVLEQSPLVDLALSRQSPELPYNLNHSATAACISLQWIIWPSHTVAPCEGQHWLLTALLFHSQHITCGQVSIKSVQHWDTQCSEQCYSPSLLPPHLACQYRSYQRNQEELLTTTNTCRQLKSRGLET